MVKAKIDQFGIVNKIRYNLHYINSHPFFIGFMMLSMNFLSKYIVIKFSKSQEEYIKNTLGRRFMLYVIMWSITRDIVYSFLLTGAFIIFVDHLFNEESKFCIVPNYLKTYEKMIDSDNDGYITNAEAEEAIEIIKKHKKQKKKQEYLRYHN